MVEQTYTPKRQRENTTMTCRHYWVIEAPLGPLSAGACQRCGEVRNFKNYIEDGSWIEHGSPDPSES